MLIANGFVCVVSLAVREEVVNEHASEREYEDNKSPDHLARYGSVRLEDLDWSTNMSVSTIKEGTPRSGQQSRRRQAGKQLTPGNYVEDKHNKSKDAASRASLPRFS